MGKLKKLAQEFKAFITRGNVVDMAVAVIIGAAFGAIVSALTNGILQPLINAAIVKAGGGNGIGLITMLVPGYVIDSATGLAAIDPATGEKIIDMATSIYIDWGTFIMKIIDFLLVALVLFIIIKVFMSLKNATAKAAEKAKANREKLVAKLKKNGLSEEEAQAQADAQIEEEAPAAPAAPTTEELLVQIRDLLAAQNATSSSTEEKAE